MNRLTKAERIERACVLAAMAIIAAVAVGVLLGGHVALPILVGALWGAWRGIRRAIRDEPR